MASQPGTFNIQELADAGAPLVGGRLYTYDYGTTSQKTAYTDQGASVAHTYTADGAGGQYIALNARGELPAPLYLTAGSYDLALKRADGSTVWTRRADGANDLSTSTGAAQIGGGMQAVSSIVALRALLKTSPSSKAVVTGYYADGDGGGGAYFLDASDTTSTDNGGTVIVATDGGRWKLAPFSRVTVRHFGAKLDGLTDIGPTINAMLSAGYTAFIPYTAAGCRIDTTVTIGRNQWVEFENPSCKVKSNNATAIFRILGNSNAVIEPAGVKGGANIDMTGAGASSTVFLMGTSSQNVASVRVLGRYVCTNCHAVYLEETHATNCVIDVQIEDVYCQYTLGRQFYSKRSRGFFLVRSFVVDHTANNYVSAWEGIRVEDFIGFEGERLDVVGPTPALLTPAYQSAANGMVFAGIGNGKASLYLTRALVDNTYGNGIIITDVSYVHGTLLSAFQNLGFGIQITNCNTVLIDRIEQMGAVGVTGASAAQHGVAISGCDMLDIACVAANFNTGNGVYLHNTTHGKFMAVTTKSNGNYGWSEDGTSNFNIKSGLISYSNTAGSLVQVGASSATVNWIPTSGTFTASTVGAATV